MMRSERLRGKCRPNEAADHPLSHKQSFTHSVTRETLVSATKKRVNRQQVSHRVRDQSSRCSPHSLDQSLSFLLLPSISPSVLHTYTHSALSHTHIPCTRQIMRLSTPVMESEQLFLLLMPDGNSKANDALPPTGSAAETRAPAKRRQRMPSFFTDHHHHNQPHEEDDTLIARLVTPQMVVRRRSMQSPRQ